MTSRRKTVQKRAIQRVFEEASRPMTPHEVWEAACVRVPSLGIATVYRLIKVLIEAGDLRRVEIPGHPPRYELAAKGPRHFFLCSNCSEVYTLPATLDNAHKLVPEGFRVHSHEIVLYGTCPKCPGEELRT